MWTFASLPSALGFVTLPHARGASASRAVEAPRPGLCGRLADPCGTFTRPVTPPGKDWERTGHAGGYGRERMGYGAGGVFGGFGER